LIPVSVYKIAKRDRYGSVGLEDILVFIKYCLKRNTIDQAPGGLWCINYL